LVASAIIGGAAGADAPRGSGPLGGFAKGGAAALQAQQERQAQQQSDRKAQATAQSQDQMRQEQNNLAQGAIAHDTLSSLNLGHHLDFHNDDELSTLNNSVQVVKNAALKNGGVVAAIPNNGKPGNGPDLMAKYNSDPLIMQGGDGTHRIPFMSYSTAGLQHKDGRWVDETGQPPDWNTRATVTLVDVPNAVWHRSISLTNQNANDVAGYAITKGKPTDTVSTTFGSLFSMGLKNKSDLIAARNDLYRAPQNENEALALKTEADKVNSDPNAPEDLKRRAAIKGPMADKFLEGVASQKSADKGGPKAPTNLDQAASALTAARIADTKNSTTDTKQAVKDAQQFYDSMLNAEKDKVPIRVDEAKRKKIAELAAQGDDDSIKTQGQMMVEGLMDPAQLSKRAKSYGATIAAANAYSMQKYGKPFDTAKASADYKFASDKGTQNTLKYLTRSLAILEQVPAETCPC
jgi:hypothetical protein